MFRDFIKSITIFVALVFPAALAHGQTPVNFKVAFIADQGLEPESQAVLNLIKDEGAQAVLHAGDFDYEKNPQAWEDQINAILGENFPYFICMGEDDEKRFFTIDGYQDRMEARMTRLAIPWDGDLGVQSSFHYNGIFFIQTAPAVEDGEHATYIREKLAEDNSFWRVSTFHKNMKRMQVCKGGNSTGWDVYEESRKGGAFTTNGQCHVYARTYLLSSMSEQTVASISDTLVLRKDLPETLEDEGRSFHAVTGLGGRSIHRQQRDGDWWATIYTKDQDATYGALFATFNYNGDPKVARFYFKNIEGAVIDSFYVHSEVKSGYLLAVDTDGLGSVDLSPAGGVYEEGDIVTLTVNPSPGWAFEGWSGDLTGIGNPITITMDTDKAVTAIFTPPEHTLTVNVEGSGTVSQEPPDSLHVWGTVVTLSAIPDSGHMFSGWSDDVSSTENPLALVIDADKSVTATFQLNNPPLVVDDSTFTDEDNALNIPAPGVLANDSDPDGDAILASLVSGPSNGSLSFNGDGSFTYTPAPDFNGGDAFVYSVTDGRGGAATGVVTVTVYPVNDPPVAEADDYNLLEDDTLRVAIPGVLDNDSDVDGDSMTVSLAVGPVNGVLTLNEDGSFAYIPSGDFNGIDAFTYSVSDGAEGTAMDTVTIAVAAVNDSPIAGDDAFSVNEDTTLTIAAPGVLSNDGDVDGDILSALLISGATNGTLTLQDDGSFTYSPNASFYGPDNFTYITSDGVGGTDTATVILTVRAVNDAPVAVDDAYSMEEDSPLSVGAPGVLSNDSDVDADSLSVSVVSGPENGTLTLDEVGSFLYTPNGNFNGVDVFEYVLSDGVGETDTATVTLTVRAVNDAPVAVDDAYTMEEDSPLSVWAPGVLSNDSDVDGVSLSVSVASDPENGTLTLNEVGSFRYTPDSNFNGVDVFEYLLSDGDGGTDTGTVILTVGAVNDPSVAVDDVYSLDEDNTLSVESPGVLSNDINLDGDSLSAAVASDPENGTLTLDRIGSFRYTPDENFNGVDTFEYKLSDGGGGVSTATVTLTVRQANDAPLAVDDGYRIEEDDSLRVAAPGVLSNDSDVDADSLIVSVSSAPENGTLTLDEKGSFQYAPNQDFNGVDTFTYSLSDTRGGVAKATVTITVHAVNDPPVVVDDVYSIEEDDTLNVAAPGVLGNDSDVDADSLIVSMARNPENGTLTLDEKGSFRYTPPKDFNGVDSFEYTLRDGNGSEATGHVKLVIKPANDQPTAQADRYTVDEDMTLDVEAPGVLVNDDDLDGDSLAVSVLSKPLRGSLILNSNGAFSYTPNGEFNGSDTFTYTVSDSNGGSAAARVSITVEPVNDSPVAREDVYHLEPGATLSIAAPGILKNDMDVDGDALVATLVDSPLTGNLRLDGDGSFTYTPDTALATKDADLSILRAFTYMTHDEQGAASNVAQVLIAISNDEESGYGANKPPLARDDAATTHRGKPVAIEVTANDTDTDGALDVSTVVVVSPPSDGSTTVDGETGVITYIPPSDFTGTESFTYTVDDQEGARSNAARVTVTVTSGSDSKLSSFPPIEDAQIKSSRPMNNYGSRIGTRVEAEEFVTYLKFEVKGLSDSLQTATLRLFVTDGSSDGGAIYSVSNNYSDTNTPWDEDTLAAGNAPVITGLPIARFGLATQDSVIEADLTAVISGDGFYSFGISKDTPDRVEYSTKEGANPPELIIKTGTGSGEVVTDVKDVENDNQFGNRYGALPETVILNSNYPNPFNAETTIQYALPRAAKVELIIYNVKGQAVRKLVEGVQQAGYKKVLWNGKDDRGADVSSGIYFLRLNVDTKRFSRKLILQK